MNVPSPLSHATRQPSSISMTGPLMVLLRSVSIEMTDEPKSIYDGAVIEDDPDSSVEHHFTALVEVQTNKSDKVQVHIW